jgi:hypothetical protein
VLGATRLGVVLCLVIATAAGFWRLPSALDHLGDKARANSSLHYDDREFAAGNGVVVDQVALYEARGLIPPHESYRIVTGPNLTSKTDLTERFIESYAVYFLMPRRPSNSARWVICYGCDRSAWGDRFELLWQDEFGIAVGRLGS